MVLIQPLETKLKVGAYKSLAIVGTHPDTRANAPFDDPTVEIWAFNEAPGGLVEDENGVARPWLKRVDAIFQMHSPTVYRNPENRSDREHWKWLQQPHPFPVYMQAVDPDVPSSVEYPLERVCKRLLDNFRYSIHQVEARFFTSSISYALALAIYDSWKYERLLIYGVEMAAETEYLMQRDCLTFWIGRALGCDWDVEMHCGGSIFKHPLYGYESDIEQNIQEYYQRRDDAIKLVVELRDREHATEVAFVQAAEAMNGGTNILDRLGDWLDASVELGVAEGIKAENDRYIFKIETMLENTRHSMIDRHEFEVGGHQAQKDRAEAEARIHRTAGTLDYVWQAWLQFRNPAAIEQIKMFGSQHVQAGRDMGKAQGVQVYNEQRLHEIDEKLRAAGGEKALEAYKIGWTSAKP